mmetsp:Transcript_21461/g.51169  ORF Transcript_21461/g.51169 Transcript_21461/m.51169 type:complete len:622 (-) Transcript_21461:108-1973(-)|eukprot:CAMPEP_0197176552 /NCGR_PEP_ID=MMETSP1423-20130617/2435_1 /TAXON_ID=476441 /ORGANISM="Pseudo-nitzschia heimii, Strain UNC1101" /LENGTH=621 /DNA_ID=CAMNT_0042625935 /DNA_START=400 /DNA_END=2265 /DNA_ORIENTATION=-
MKREKLLSILAVLVISRLPSSLIQGKNNDAKSQRRHSYNDHHNSIRFVPSFSQKNVYKQEIPREKESKLSFQVDVPITPSSQLHRDLKQTSSQYFFFEQCSEVCAASGGVATILDDDCCEGGVSYLKVKFHAEDQIIGTIALDTTHSPSCDHSQTYSSHKGTKAGFRSRVSPQSKSSNYEHRIVDCNVECIKNPFGGSTCNENPVLHEKIVQTGTEICIAMVKSSSNETYDVAFDEKMPTEINVLFLSNKGFSVGAIHTSCSVPLSQPWGVRLEDPCLQSSSTTGKEFHTHRKHINISDIPHDSPPYLSFVDGISTKYFGAVDAVLRAPDALSYAQDFSISFKSCGCTCNLYNTTLSSNPSGIPIRTPSKGPYTSSTPSKGPATNPSLFPSIVPSEDSKLFLTLLPSINTKSFPTTNPSPIPAEKDSSISISSISTSPPTSVVTSSFSPGESSQYNPGSGAPSGSSCKLACTAFILENCVFIGTNAACDMYAEFPSMIDDDLEEGAKVGTIIPNAPADGMLTMNDSGKIGKGTKGKKRNDGKAVKNGKEDKKSAGQSYAQKGNKKMGQILTNLGKTNKGEGLKSDKQGRYSFNPGDDRRLKEIKYHQSRIENLKMLLQSVL